MKRKSVREKWSFRRNARGQLSVLWLIIKGIAILRRINLSINKTFRERFIPHQLIKSLLDLCSKKNVDFLPEGTKSLIKSLNSQMSPELPEISCVKEQHRIPVVMRNFQKVSKTNVLRYLPKT